MSRPADEGSAGLDATEVTPAGRDEPAAAPAARGAVTADALVAEIPGLWRFALALMRDEADAEDLVQETLARALERGSSFRGESGLATWLHRIAHNLAVDGFRRRGREVDVDEVEDRWRDDDYTVDAEAVADRAHDRAELEDALVHLPFALRAAVLLHDVEGWTVKEIAEMSEIGVPALLGEIGVDMTKFKTHGHLLSWARMCPRLDQSAGKVHSTRTQKGAVWVKTLLIQAAWAAIKTKNSYLRAQFLRLRARRGAKKAIGAVAASILTAAYYVIRDRTPYRDLGIQYFQHRDRSQSTRRLVARLEQLGYSVQLSEVAA